MSVTHDSSSIRVLLAGNRGAFSTLDHTARACNWELRQTPTVEGAHSLLAAWPCSILLAEERLPDGDWRDLLHRVHRSARGPRLIVLSDRCEPALFAEVVHLGGDDVLTVPFTELEVTRLVVQTWWRWRNGR